MNGQEEPPYVHSGVASTRSMSGLGGGSNAALKEERLAILGGSAFCAARLFCGCLYTLAFRSTIGRLGQTGERCQRVRRNVLVGVSGSALTGSGSRTVLSIISVRSGSDR